MSKRCVEWAEMCRISATRREDRVTAVVEEAGATRSAESVRSTLAVSDFLQRDLLYNPPALLWSERQHP